MKQSQDIFKDSLKWTMEAQSKSNTTMMREVISAMKETLHSTVSAMKETLHSSVTKIESMCSTGLGKKRSG